jgi:hypothetical protein
MIEAQAHPLDQRRQVPRVDRLAVDRGLMADRSRRARQAQAGDSGWEASAESRRAIMPAACSSAPASATGRPGGEFAVACIGFADLVKATAD